MRALVDQRRAKGDLLVLLEGEGASLVGEAVEWVCRWARVKASRAGGQI